MMRIGTSSQKIAAVEAAPGATPPLDAAASPPFAPSPRTATRAPVSTCCASGRWYPACCLHCTIFWCPPLTLARVPKSLGIRALTRRIDLQWQDGSTKREDGS